METYDKITQDAAYLAEHKTQIERKRKQLGVHDTPPISQKQQSETPQEKKRHDTHRETYLGSNGKYRPIFNQQFEGMFGE
jgi:hypothetical protein